jgi:AraC-like DNA-binding protein
MQDWVQFFEIVLDFSSTIILTLLIILVNIGLKWLPSKNKISFFLALFLTFKLVAFSFIIFNFELSYKIYILLLPSILLIGPLMTRFTQSTLLMQKSHLFDSKAIVLWATGVILLLPYLIVPTSVAQRSPSELPLLLFVSVNAFVFLFVVTSSMHFLKMNLQFYRGALYSVGYSENTYHWLKGVWFSMTFLWVSLLYNMISGVIDIPWPEIISTIASALDIFVLFSLVIVTALYCKKPADQPVINLCKEVDKYGKSALSKELAQDILHSVDTVMHTDKLFLNSNLNIEKLARVINTQPQYLSQAINQYRQVNFYELVASYRIEYAQETLRQEPGKSILTVAMEAGFNSKSTFNKTFKKIT